MNRQPWDIHDAEALKAWRSERGQTQRELAREVGLSDVMISNMERLKKPPGEGALSVLLDAGFRRPAPVEVPVAPSRLPRTRRECEGGARPCPLVSCRHHLFLDVNPLTGSIKLNFPGLAVWELPETCSLDVAARSSHTLAQLAPLFGMVSEQGARQLLLRALEAAEPLLAVLADEDDHHKGAA